MTFWGPEKLPSPDDPEAPATAPASDARRARPLGHVRRAITPAMRMATAQADMSGMSRRRS